MADIDQPPNPFLPPLYPGTWTHSVYLWCQVRSVIARELTRAAKANGDPIAWLSAWWSEAGLLEQAMRKGMGERAALGFGSRAGEAYWPDVACFAWAYASHPPELRAQIRQAVAQGQVPSSLLDPSAGTLCPREVASDPAYWPEPACHPVEVARPAAMLAAGVAAGGLIALVVTALSRRLARRR